ncbi:MAG: hypothetical protein CXZ00_09845 [Acidobacteria bacterium]|nr:MAG: hypothetical protein CXZ00_09845 [Acidobacteriota bacterium]
MLSKCLNAKCSAVFRYWGQGRLFRFNFTEVEKKCARAGKKNIIPMHSETYPIEHFWICDECARAMTVELSELGEVRLVLLEPSRRPSETIAVRTIREMASKACQATAS